MSFNAMMTPFAGMAGKGDPSLELLFEQQQQQGLAQQSLRTELGAILDNILGGEKCTETNIRCDVIETEQHYFVALELPGIALQDIQIDITEDGGSATLTVSCERKLPFDETSVSGGASYLQKESANGRLQRKFNLPKDAAASQASAKLNLAVLTITIPRNAQVVPQGRRIIAISSQPLQQQQGQQRGSQTHHQPQPGSQQRPSQGDGTPASQRSKK